MAYLLPSFVRLYGVSFRGRFGGLAVAEHHIRAAVAVVIAVFTEESCSDSSRNSGISMSFHVVYSLSLICRGHFAVFRAAKVSCVWGKGRLRIIPPWSPTKF